MGSRPVLGQVVGLADSRRAEAGAGPVRRTAVERGADHHDVCGGERGRILDVDRGYAEEGDVGAELRAVARHGVVLSVDGAARPTDSVTIGAKHDGSACPKPCTPPSWRDHHPWTTNRYTCSVRTITSTTMPTSSRPLATTSGCTSRDTPATASPRCPSSCAVR